MNAHGGCGCHWSRGHDVADLACVPGAAARGRPLFSAWLAGTGVKRHFRVRRNTRFQEIRSRAKAFSNDVLVIAALPNDLPYSRFGFSVSARVGGAVERNRIKRQLRESMRLRMAQVAPGWDIVIIARKPARDADYWKLDAACARLLGRAHLLNGEGKL